MTRFFIENIRCSVADGGIVCGPVDGGIIAEAQVRTEDNNIFYLIRINS